MKNARSKCHCALMMQWKFHPRCDLESLFSVPFLAFFVILGNNFVSKCPTLEYRIIFANTIINTQKNYTQEHGVNTGFVSWWKTMGNIRNEIVFDIQVHLFEEVLCIKLNLSQKARKWHKKKKNNVNQIMIRFINLS